MSRDWILQVRPPAASPFELALERETSLGRADSNTIALPDHSVSSQHAVVRPTRAGGWEFVDLGSRNGSFRADGSRITPQEPVPLVAGLELRVGRTVLRFSACDGTAIHVDPLATVPRGEIDTVVPQPVQPPQPEPAGETILAPRAAAAPPPGPAPVPPPRPSAPPPRPATILPPAPPPAPPPEPPEADDPFGSIAEPTVGVRPTGAAAEAAAIATLHELRPRLLVLDEADPRAVPLTQIDTLIGRSSRAGCRIDLHSISAEHAQLSYSNQDRSFQIVDLGSQNGTAVRRITLAPDRPQLVEPDDHLRIGPIDAVLRADRTLDMTPVPASFDLGVAARLVARGKLAKGDLARRRKQAQDEGVMLGDALLLAGVVRAQDWSEAAREERSNPTAAGGRSGGLVLALVLVLLAGAAYGAYRMGWLDSLLATGS